jgi:phasin family protein
MTTRTATKTAANASQDLAHDGVNVMKEATEKVGSFVAETQKSMTDHFEKVSKGFEGMSTFGQENMEAVVKSSELAAKAFEGIGSEITAYSKKTFEDSVSAAQELAAAKTMTELFEKQTAFAQSAFEGWLHQATKMNEIITAAAKDVSAPLGKRVSAATDAVKGFAL